MMHLRQEKPSEAKAIQVSVMATHGAPSSLKEE